MQPEKDRWLQTTLYIASKSIWSIEEKPITSSIHILIIYSKTSINSAALSMFDHKANDHSYSHRALFVLSSYLLIFEIREQTSLTKHTVHENHNYFVMPSSSLHLQSRYFPVSTPLICRFRSINLNLYHLHACYMLQLLVRFVLWPCALIFENTHTIAPLLVRLYFVSTSQNNHIGESQSSLYPARVRGVNSLYLRPRKQIVIIITVNYHHQYRNGPSQ